MALKLITDYKHKDRGNQIVALDPKRKRLGIYKQTMVEMIKHYGGPFEYVQIYIDPESPNKFWLKPCQSSAEGARKLGQTSLSTRGLSISLLLEELHPKPTTTVRLPLTWDEEHAAGRVDLVSANKEKSET
ncbi:MAG: hypothetical protein ACP5VS_18355 [Desulfomonilaceae bacterium]